MQRLISTHLSGLAAVAAVALALFAATLAYSAHANESRYCYNFLFSNATTTKAYITAGAATTTQTVANCSDGTTGFESGAVTLSIISSTTPPTVALRYEVSRDGIDYYPWPISSNANVATTTLMLTGANEYKWIAMASSTDMAGTGIASSSAGTAVNLRGATFNQTLVLPATPFPYFRIKYYVPVGAPAVALSAEVLVKKEQLAH
jgi:hypothetical protein